MSTEPTPEIEEHRFADDGVVPNNSRLPLVVYRGVLEAGPDAAAACEKLFAGNGWSGGWRGGVYPYHHYHTTAHEALGIVAGSAKVRLGGDSGAVVDLNAGDAVVIPAGVAHKGEAASPDLLIVGAYPGGASACYGSGVRHSRTVDRALGHRLRLSLKACCRASRPGALAARNSRPL